MTSFCSKVTPFLRMMPFLNRMMPFLRMVPLKSGAILDMRVAPFLTWKWRHSQLEKKTHTKEVQYLFPKSPTGRYLPQWVPKTDMDSEWTDTATIFQPILDALTIWLKTKMEQAPKKYFVKSTQTSVRSRSNFFYLLRSIFNRKRPFY